MDVSEILILSRNLIIWTRTTKSYLNILPCLNTTQNFMFNFVFPFQVQKCHSLKKKRCLNIKTNLRVVSTNVKIYIIWTRIGQVILRNYIKFSEYPVYLIMVLQQDLLQKGKIKK